MRRSIIDKYCYLVPDPQKQKQILEQHGKAYKTFEFLICSFVMYIVILMGVFSLMNSIESDWTNIILYIYLGIVAAVTLVFIINMVRIEFNKTKIFKGQLALLTNSEDDTDHKTILTSYLNFNKYWNKLSALVILGLIFLFMVFWGLNSAGIGFFDLLQILCILGFIAFIIVFCFATSRNSREFDAIVKRIEARKQLSLKTEDNGEEVL